VQRILITGQEDSGGPYIIRNYVDDFQSMNYTLTSQEDVSVFHEQRWILKERAMRCLRVENQLSIRQVLFKVERVDGVEDDVRLPFPLVQTAFDLEDQDILTPAIFERGPQVPLSGGTILDPVQNPQIVPPGQFGSERLQNCFLRPRLGQSAHVTEVSGAEAFDSGELGLQITRQVLVDLGSPPLRRKTLAEILADGPIQEDRGRFRKRIAEYAKRMRMLKINDLDRPQRDYNLALSILALSILALSILALSIGLQVVDSMRCKFYKRALLAVF